MKNLSLRNNGNYLSDFFSDPFDSFFRPLWKDERIYAMKTDITESEKEYTLEIDLPGFDKKDIKLDYENGYITVNASRSEKDEDKKSYIRRERNVSASRSYYIGEVDESKVSAKFEGGVLTIVVPKKEAEKPVKRGINID